MQALWHFIAPPPTPPPPEDLPPEASDEHGQEQRHGHAPQTATSCSSVATAEDTAAVPFGDWRSVSAEQAQLPAGRPEPAPEAIAGTGAENGATPAQEMEPIERTIAGLQLLQAEVERYFAGTKYLCVKSSKMAMQLQQRLGSTDFGQGAWVCLFAVSSFLERIRYLARSHSCPLMLSPTVLQS
eukprot:scaffold1033_cov408-Prasinococcus_capsulatus_cf.AAC.10